MSGRIEARLKELGLVDEVLPEPLGGAHRAPEAMAEAVQNAVLHAFAELEALSIDALLAERRRQAEATASEIGAIADRYPFDLDDPVALFHARTKTDLPRPEDDPEQRAAAEGRRVSALRQRTWPARQRGGSGRAASERQVVPSGGPS